MESSIADYTKAVTDHIEAVKTETKARWQVEKTHHALLMARQAMRDMEKQLLEEIEVRE